MVPRILSHLSSWQCRRPRGVLPPHFGRHNNNINNTNNSDSNNNNDNNNNETGSRSPCMRPRSDPQNFGPIERGEKQPNNID